MNNTSNSVRVQRHDRAEKIKVLPFVGERYGVESPIGLPTLILGESHYSVGPLYEEFTRDVLQEVFEAPWKPWMIFFARTAGLFQGGWLSREDRNKFWSSVAFYNYIQETVGDRPRMRPTKEMWLTAVPAFEEVLVQHKPKFILVLGYELWNNLPAPVKEGPMVQLPDGQTMPTRLYANDAGYAVAFGIAHPAAPGWSYEKWSPWVRAALAGAIRFQNTQ